MWGRERERRRFLMIVVRRTERGTRERGQEISRSCDFHWKDGES
jgi:hypothetical protein